MDDGSSEHSNYDPKHVLIKQYELQKHRLVH